MALKVCVMSPLHNLGSTVVSTLLAQGLTFDNKTTALLFTQQNSLLPKYVNVVADKDPTRSIMQVVKLIDNGALEDKDILEYSYSYSKNSWLLNAADPSLSGSDRDRVINHVYGRIKTDVVICDNSDDLNSNLSEKLMQTSNVIFIVTDMSTKSIERVKVWLDNFDKDLLNKTYIIVNKYDEVVSAVRNIAKMLSLPANRVCKLHYNPWITKCSLNGQLHTILPLSRELDPRVSNLNNDINELTQCINNMLVARAMNTKKGL